MARYLLNRAIQILVTLFIFLSIVFFLVNAQPGDASNFYALSPDIPPETREKLRELFGVNQPLWKQYLIHVKNTAHRQLRRLVQPLPQKRFRRDNGTPAPDAHALLYRVRPLLLSWDFP